MQYIIPLVLFLNACTTQSTTTLPDKSVTFSQLVDKINIPSEKSPQYKDEQEVRLAIKRKVMNNWVQSPASAKDLSCSISISLSPSGEISELIITHSNGNNDFDKSAITALRKASPLPIPNDFVLFEKNFKNFSFTFIPFANTSDKHL